MPAGYTPETPLTVACRTGDLDAARVLLDAGASPNERDRMGRSPLEWAGTPELTALLLDRGARLDDRDADGRSVLCFASGRDRAAKAELLVTRGADLFAPGADGGTALRDLLRFGSGPAFVRLLLDLQERVGLHPTPRGAAFDAALGDAYRVRQWAFDVATRGVVGDRWTLFLDPIELGRLDVLDPLLTTPRFDARGVSGLDPVGTCVCSPRAGVALLRRLLDAGCPADVPDNSGTRPLAYAVRYARTAMVTALGGDPEAPAPTDAVARGVEYVDLHAHPPWCASFGPSPPSLALGSNGTRAEVELGARVWAPRELRTPDGATLREEAAKAGVTWFLSLFEAVAAGRTVRIAEIERAAPHGVGLAHFGVE